MAPGDLHRLALPAEPADAARTPLYFRGAGVRREGGTLRLDPHATADLGTWLNAAPVGWWRTVVGPGHLRLRVRGSGRLTVWRSTGDSREVAATAELDGAWETYLPRTGADRWMWLELTAGADGGVLEAVEWAAGSRLGRPEGAARVTVVVPTFRRERDATAQVRRLLGPALDGTVGRVVLVDQGGTLAAGDGWASAAAEAGDRLVLLHQGNLGGSGGYARGMVESLRWPDDPVLLLDDDAEIDPESLRRMHALSVAAPVPTVLGTGLVSAESGRTLEALAEGVTARTFRWGPVDGLGDGTDLADGDPTTWRFADPRAQATYTGWWGTLLPAGTVARLGLPVPYFLKWDDAEYGLRAGDAGLRRVTMPGAVVWHPTWAAKGTISSWSAWPLHRNRLATATARGAGRGVLRDSLVHQVKHVLSLQYETADLWDAALAEVLDGPGWLDTDVLDDVRLRAQARLDAAPRAPTDVAHRTAPPLPAAVGAVRAVLGLLRPAGGEAVAVPAAEASWRSGLGRDALALLGAAGVDRVLVRDPARARTALRRTVRLHVTAAVRWAALGRSYRTALPRARAAGRWQRRFAEVR